MSTKLYITFAVALTAIILLCAHIGNLHSELSYYKAVSSDLHAIILDLQIQLNTK